MRQSRCSTDGAGYRSRWRKSSGLAKLNFQVLRRTVATFAQTKASIKDVQGILGHSKADRTVMYRQSIEDGVKQKQRADGTAETGGKYQESEKFDTLWYGGCFGRSASDCPARAGRLTQR